MPNGSNCALNHAAQLNSYSGCIKKNYCYICANDMWTKAQLVYFGINKI